MADTTDAYSRNELKVMTTIFEKALLTPAFKVLVQGAGFKEAYARARRQLAKVESAANDQVLEELRAPMRVAPSNRRR